MVILKVEELKKYFGGIKAVDGVSFEVNKNEIVGIIGPNGSGKTTLINVITGFYKQTGGRVFFDGRNIAGLSPYKISRLGIARTFQIVRPFFNLNVFENVFTASLFGRNLRRSYKEAREIAQEAIEAVGLEDKMNLKPASLSLAEKKKLEIAKALSLSPTVLFLDESMAGLNSKEVHSSMELILKLKEKKKLTIIFVEHIMKVVMGISERVIVLHHGKKIAEGKPEEVVNNQNVIEAYLGKRFKKVQNA